MKNNYISIFIMIFLVGCASTTTVKQSGIHGVIAPAPPNTSNHEQPIERATIREYVKLSDMSIKQVTIPAVTETVQRRVVQTPARTVERTIPAQTRYETRRIVKTPAKTIERVVPAVTQQIAVKNPETGEIEYQTRVSQPQSIEYISVPAVYETVQEPVIVQEATTELVTIPAQYKTISERVVKTPARTENTIVPAKYESRLKEVKHATVPFSWNKIESFGYSRPPAFNPPPSKAEYEVGEDFFIPSESAENTDINLWQVYEKLSSLIQSENDANMNFKVYSYPQGYVLLTSAERIDENANPLMINGKRIATTGDRSNNWFKNIYTKLFNRDDNRIRYIAFIVKPKGYVKAGDEISTSQQFESIFLNGGNQSDLVAKEYFETYFLRHHKYTCIARVFEYQRIDQTSPNSLPNSKYKVVREPLTRERHLSGSNILQAFHKSGS